MFEHYPFLDENTGKTVYTDDTDGSGFFPPGTAAVFRTPTVSRYALEHLNYLSRFSLVHWTPSTYTIRFAQSRGYMLLYCCGGEGHVEYQGQVYPLTAGQGVFLNCYFSHLYAADSHWKYILLLMDGPQVTARYLQYSDAPDPVFAVSDEREYLMPLERLLSLYESAGNEKDWAVSDCIAQIAETAVKARFKKELTDSSMPENIALTRQYMQRHFSEDLSLDFLAEFAGISKYHFSREFKKYTGFSPKEYLIRLRLQKARYLLTGSSLPISRIAAIAGFHDINNFNTLFKKDTAMTPGQYRESR